MNIMSPGNYFFSRTYLLNEFPYSLVERDLNLAANVYVGNLDGHYDRVQTTHGELNRERYRGERGGGRERGRER